MEAAIVAARSVTLLMQKQYHGIEGFDKWYEMQQAKLDGDPLARFLLARRNFILKQGIAEIRKHVHVVIHDAASFSDSARVKIVPGSLKSRLKQIFQDPMIRYKEKWAEIKRQRECRRHQQVGNQSTITQAYYFMEKDWSNKPATELLKNQLDTLECIVNEASAKFGIPPTENNVS
jgi:hypothetical protein